MKEPAFTFDDIKFADSQAVFDRAWNLYRKGKVKNISELPFGFSATVHGTRPYSVSVSLKRVDDGHCTCYLGQNNILCKHMLALALAALFLSGKADENIAEAPATTEPGQVKKLVTSGMRKLKPYTGPSRIWFSYQRNLATGAGMIAHAVSALPPSKQNADFLWKVIERIDKKLANGVDDSDGVVGDCAYRIIEQLAGYAKSSPELRPVIRRYADKKTNFDFDTDLRLML